MKRLPLLLILLTTMFLTSNDWFFQDHAHRRWFDPATTWFGWLPSDMLYHLAWAAVGILVCRWMLSVTWRPRP